MALPAAEPFGYSQLRQVDEALVQFKPLCLEAYLGRVKGERLDCALPVKSPGFAN